MRRTSCTLFVSALFFLLPAARPSGQQPAAPPATSPPSQGITFRSIANYVEVDAIVTDRAGMSVTNLETGDFEVLEDGKPQALRVCTFVNIPVERPDPLLSREQAAPREVFTNEKGFDGRVFMFVLDGFHVGAVRSMVVRRQARLFIERYLGQNDLAAVIHIGAPAAGQEFTGNKRLLLASVDRFGGTALPSPTHATIQDALAKEIAAASGVDPGPPTDMEAQVRSFMAKESFDSLRRLSEYMGALSGRRKALLFFSEGFDYNTTDEPTDATAGRMLRVQDASAVRTAQDVSIAQATPANVSIYAIDPRGATNGLEEPVAKLPLAEGRYGFLASEYLTMLKDDLNRAHDSLRLLADQTGGLVFLNQNDEDATFRRILDDNSAYYVLGYSSPETRRDGKFHRISVKVKRPGLEVRVKNGYHAPLERAGAKVKTLDAVNQLIANPAPVTGLGMRMNAAVMKGLLNKSTVHLTVEFNGKDLPTRDAGGLATNDVDIKYIAVNMKGESQAARREVAHLQLKSATVPRFPQYGMRWVTEFELAPGRYQLRVAAREQLGGKTGSVFADIEVPDFATLPFSMSDLLITSTSAPKTVMGISASNLGAVLPTPTTTSREFAPADALTVLASFYDTVTDVPHTVDLKATVQSDAGARLFQREEARSSKDMQPAAGGYRWQLNVPLTGYAPGRYVLIVEGRTRLGTGAALTREIEFRVR